MTMDSCVTDAIAHFGLDMKSFEEKKVFKMKNFILILTLVLNTTRENFKRFCEWKDITSMKKYTTFCMFSSLLTPDDFDCLCEALDCTLDPKIETDVDIFREFVFEGNIPTILHVAKKCNMIVNWDFLVGNDLLPCRIQGDS